MKKFSIFLIIPGGRTGTDFFLSLSVWHLDVGSSHPGAGAGPKGLAVRQLKWYVSWVQNVARQFGPYLPWASKFERS